MNTELIKKALIEAYRLLQNEMKSLCYNDLEKEYQNVLSQLDQAINEINKESIQ